jgi:hypothetical protein
LRIAAITLPDPEKVYKEGLDMMDRHRQNYDETGANPQKLQILWWMFPEEHWEGLRLGSSMNFLLDPEGCIHLNAKMTDEQKRVAGAFIDELVKLGALEEPPLDDPIITTSPLFCVPKPYQPGEWRVIANCREGGQNEVVGSDPVILPRMNHILSQMYAGGWTAVVDASKMFYQFDTHPEERKFLGLTHPITGKRYRYKGLPMGAGNSPAIAGRYSAGLIRQLKKHHLDLFSGLMLENSWRTGMNADETNDYDPAKGMGMIWTGADDTAAALIWSFVDDFCLHAPTYAKCCAALTAFMDLTVDCGFLCHPGKLVPPSQEVKYIGYLVNTVGIPNLRIPEAKKDKALMMISRLLDHPDDPVSALAFSVVTGTLESVVEATPQRQGRCYLREMYNALHDVPGCPDADAAPEFACGGGDTLDDILASRGVYNPLDKYYRTMLVTESAREELRWWYATLTTVDVCRSAYSERGGALSTTWGDGSGTGTGGTIDVTGMEVLQWMGSWLPASLPYTSNWKELKTLCLTLEQLLHDPSRRKAVKGTTLFYFTDNEVTYYIAHSGSSSTPALHALIMHIKDLERKLDLHLEVVHVPGTTMIAQGTDGLSRGIWISYNHTSQPTLQYTCAVFDPATHAEGMEAWVAGLCERTDHPSLRHWDVNWVDQAVLGQFTLWLPPPAVARQLLSHLLNLWTESPWETSFVAVIPRVMQQEWAYLTRYMTRLGSFKWEVIPFPCPELSLPIPLVVLYTSPHLRALPKHRKSPPALPSSARWHREQADQMRGLPI